MDIVKCYGGNDFGVYCLIVFSWVREKLFYVKVLRRKDVKVVCYLFDIGFECFFIKIYE